MAPAGDVCGEGAVWAAAEGRLYWTDINRFLIHALTVGGRERADLVLRRAGGGAGADRPAGGAAGGAGEPADPVHAGGRRAGGARAGAAGVAGGAVQRRAAGSAGAAGDRHDGQQRRAGGRGAGGGAGAGEALPLRAGARRSSSSRAGSGSPTRSAGARTRGRSTSPTRWPTRSAPTPSTRRPGTVGASRPFLAGFGRGQPGRVGGGQRGLSLELPLRRGVRGAGGAGRDGRAGGGDAVREHHHLHLRRARGCGRSSSPPRRRGAGRRSGWRGASSRWRRRCRGCRSGCSGWGRRPGGQAGQRPARPAHPPACRPLPFARVAAAAGRRRGWRISGRSTNGSGRCTRGKGRS